MGTDWVAVRVRWVRPTDARCVGVSGADRLSMVVVFDDYKAPDSNGPPAGLSDQSDRSTSNSLWRGRARSGTALTDALVACSTTPGTGGDLNGCGSFR